MTSLSVKASRSLPSVGQSLGQAGFPDGVPGCNRQARRRKVPILSHRGFLTPAARRHGIGRALLRHNEARLRDEPVRPDGSGRRFFHSWADEASTGTTTLLGAEGYAATRWFFEMLRPTLDDLPVATLPPGLEVRPVTTEPQAIAVMLAEGRSVQGPLGACAADGCGSPALAR